MATVRVYSVLWHDPELVECDKREFGTAWVSRTIDEVHQEIVRSLEEDFEASLVLDDGGEDQEVRLDLNDRIARVHRQFAEAADTVAGYPPTVFLSEAGWYGLKCQVQHHDLEPPLEAAP